VSYPSKRSVAQPQECKWELAYHFARDERPRRFGQEGIGMDGVNTSGSAMTFLLDMDVAF